MKKNKIFLVGAVAAFAGVLSLHGAPVLVESYTFDANTELWEITPDLGSNMQLGWDDGDVATTWEIAGIDGGFLTVFGDSDLGGQADFVTVSPGSGFIGNWNSAGSAWTFGMNAIVSFDLYADTGTAGFDYPAGLFLYFESDDGGGAHQWWYDLSDEAEAAFSADPGSWQSFSSTISSFSTGGWGSPTSGNLDNWIDGFSNVTDFGIYLSYPIGDDQFYGLDNFGLNVAIPEPGAMMLLGSALLSLSVTFRKQIKTRAGELLKS